MGAWIEIYQSPFECKTSVRSHPTMGAWIEIWKVSSITSEISGRTPRWVRGLKSCYHITIDRRMLVAPHDGCVDWNVRSGIHYFDVLLVSHPTMGAWIEIMILYQQIMRLNSRTPRWVRGLKSVHGQPSTSHSKVAPHDGCVDWNRKSVY